jgi:hypothetical protein
MFSMMPESIEYIASYCDYVLRRATPKFKMAESQAGSTKDRNKLFERTFKQHREKLTCSDAPDTGTDPIASIVLATV